jgi:GNAT superfamily N-acetyltransferase
MIAIRPARAEEADALTALCRRSKAHWGYDAAFLQASAQALTITNARIADGRALVAVDDDDRPLGIATAQPLNANGDFDLLHLFVEPEAIGSHVGAALFRAIVDLLRREGARRLLIEADPNASAFYERMGAAHIGEAPSESIPGRMLPLFEFRIG